VLYIYFTNLDIQLFFKFKSIYTAIRVLMYETKHVLFEE